MLGNLSANKPGKRQAFPTITQSFLNQVRSFPQRKIFHYKEGTQWKELTWKEFYETARLISMGLLELGSQPGDRVGLISNTRVEWAAVDMAILGAKGITVPVYASNTPDETAYIVNHCDAEIVFVEDSKQLEKLLSVRDQLPKLKRIIAFSFRPTPDLAAQKDVLTLSALRELGKRALKTRGEDVFDRNLMAAKPEDVFTICYTSGTTGVPKGVVLTFDSLASVIEDVALSLGDFASDRDTVLSFLPASHILGKVEGMSAYHFGWRVYYAESVEKILFNMSEVSPTLIFAVPRIFEKAYNKILANVDASSPSKRKLFHWALDAGRAYFEKIWSDQRPTPAEFAKYQLARALVFKKVYAKFGGRIRYCITGGAPLPREIGEFMRIVGLSVLEGYGLTETCAPVTINFPGREKFGSIGNPLPEVALKIADDGEILVKSRKVFREYFKNPEATREVKDSDGWFHTGDIGTIDGAGYVRITDRKKDLIITSGGKNIAPQKIENLAKSQKFISQFVAHGDRRNYLTALIVLEKEALIKYAHENDILFSEYAELVKNPQIHALVQSIVDELNSHLASFETIKHFKVLANDFTIETGELTPSLKIRRRFINEKYRADFDAMYADEHYS